MEKIQKEKDYIGHGKSNNETIIGGGGFLVSLDAKKRYGKLFEETMMEIKASMALAEFDKDYQLRNPEVTADTILKYNINNWGDTLNYSAYSKMIPLTQLMIAACSNEPNIQYHRWIQEGYPMDNLISIRKNGKKLYVNDFLYGMMYDPIHIMEEFDKYMGDGKYIDFLKKTDMLYEKCVKTDKIDDKLMKNLMKTIAEFANRRTKDLQYKGFFSTEEVYKLSGNFNKIWNGILSQKKEDTFGPR